MPGGKSFSVIRVEADGTQRLWKFPIDGGEPSLVLKEIKPVGYQAWADAKTVLIFVLGEPPTLQKADTVTGKAEVIIENVGRSLHKVPGREAVSFVHKVAENDWQIKSLETGTGKIRTITQTLPEREDYAWTPKGTLVMGRDGKLYLFRPGTGQGLERSRRFCLRRDSRDHAAIGQPRRQTPRFREREIVVVEPTRSE